MNKAILIGNPNTGKTTLYNTLTGTNEHVGNWHGVTVDVREHAIKNSDTTLCDLPGLYSLNGLTQEEKLALNFLNNNKESLVINICDANNLRRNLYLTTQLIDLGYDVCLAVNFIKELKNSNVIIEKLQKLLNIPVFGIDARNKKGVKALNEFVLKKKQTSVNERAVNTPSIKTNLKQSAKDIYTKIDKILNFASYLTKDNYGESKLDKLLLNKYFSPIIFLAIFGLMFFVTFGDIGKELSNLLCFEALNFINSILPVGISTPWINSLVYDGIIGGVLSVISFLPQIVLLFFFINLLEDMGYLSRLAFMLDGMFSKIGLSGRSVFSLLMGFGCTTSAVVTTRNLETQQHRKTTALMLPNFSCSAKLPIYACIASAFFTNKVIIIFGLYLLGMLVSVIIAAINAKINKIKPQQMLIMEMPKLRVPKLANVIKTSIGHAKDFFVRVFSIILVMSILVWFITNFTFSFEFIDGANKQSILQIISVWLTPIFAPIGLNKPAIVIALLTGLVAKEMVLATLMMANGVVTVSELSASLFNTASAVWFTNASAISFLIFVLLYPVCVSAISTTSKEIGPKPALVSVAVQLVLAYVISLVAYLSLTNNVAKVIISVLLCVIVLALLIKLVLQYSRKTCRSNCSGCKGKHNTENCANQLQVK